MRNASREFKDLDISEVVRREVAKQLAQSLEFELAPLKKKLRDLESRSGGTFWSVDDCCGRPKKNEEKTRMGIPGFDGYNHGYNLLALSDSKPACADTSDEGHGYSPLTISDGKSASGDISGQGDALPESMFNYCIERLADSPSPWTDLALMQLICLQSIQQMLIAGFSQVNYQHLLNRHWKAPEDRFRVVSDCFYSERSFDGQPIFFLVISAVAIVLVLLALKSETEDLLSIRYRKREESGLVLWLFLNVSWFLQTIYMPAIFAVETAALFANSPDILAVIMNTLAVTFLLEIDNMMYVNVLSDEAKARYQKQSIHPDRPHVNRSLLPMLGMGMTLGMYVHFSAVRFLSGYSGEEYMMKTKKLYLSYALLIGLRGTVLTYANHRSLDQTCVHTAVSCCFRFVLFALCAPLWFFFIFWLTTGRILGSDVDSAAARCCEWANE